MDKQYMWFLFRVRLFGSNLGELEALLGDGWNGHRVASGSRWALFELSKDVDTVDLDDSAE